jgi:hypothetical protein
MSRRRMEEAERPQVVVKSKMLRIVGDMMSV